MQSNPTTGRVVLAKAADMCALSIQTMRRNREKGMFPSAARQTVEPNSPWEVDVADLVAAGLYDPTAEDGPSSPSGATGAALVVEQQAAEIEMLRAQLGMLGAQLDELRTAVVRSAA